MTTNASTVDNETYIETMLDYKRVEDNEVLSSYERIEPNGDRKIVNLYLSSDQVPTITCFNATTHEAMGLSASEFLPFYNALLDKSVACEWGRVDY